MAYRQGAVVERRREVCEQPPVGALLAGGHELLEGGVKERVELRALLLYLLELLQQLQDLAGITSWCHFDNAVERPS